MFSFYLLLTPVAALARCVLHESIDDANHQTLVRIMCDVTEVHEFSDECPSERRSVQTRLTLPHSSCAPFSLDRAMDQCYRAERRTFASPPLLSPLLPVLSLLAPCFPLLVVAGLSLAPSRFALSI
jgi:hypothetical protein